MAAGGIYFSKDDIVLGFTGECFCLSGGTAGTDTLDGILRGYRVKATNDGKNNFVVTTPLQTETLTLGINVSGGLVLKSGSVTFPQVLETTSTENMCIDIDTFSGLWLLDGGTNTFVTANGYCWEPLGLDPLSPCDQGTEVTTDMGGDVEPHCLGVVPA